LSSLSLMSDLNPTASLTTSRRTGKERGDCRVAVLYQGHGPPVFEGGVRKPAKPGGESSPLWCFWSSWLLSSFYHSATYLLELLLGKAGVVSGTWSIGSLG
jgi:hypothetical protein